MRSVTVQIKDIMVMTGSLVWTSTSVWIVDRSGPVQSDSIILSTVWTGPDRPEKIMTVRSGP